VIRVVHVVHSFGTGGLEKGIATLVDRAASDLGHTVLCLTRSGESEKLLPPGTRVFSLDKRPGNSLRFVLRLARILRSERPDVVHTRNWGGMDGILAARLARLPAVLHGEHGWGMDDPDGANRKRILARRFTSRCVRGYTCVSQDIERWLLERVRVRAPVRQIYNGVDAARFRPGRSDGRIRRGIGIPDRAFVVTICGRLDPIKDHETLFRALRELRRRHPESHLLVVGDGPERRALERQAGEGVWLLGERADVPQILAETDVFVLPSLNEGISNTILEAMAAGVPVVASRCGGNPELVVDGECGCLFTPGRDDEIVGALERYASDTPLRRAHGESGRRRAIAHFGIEQMVERYEDVYRRVNKARRGTAAFGPPTGA